jgi:hypothetical protein
MRHRFLFMILFLAGNVTAFTQEAPGKVQPGLHPIPPMPQVKLQTVPAPVNDSNAIRRPGNAPYIKNWLSAGVVIDSNQRGKVYKMPVDNMRCLAPNVALSAPIPVKRSRIPEHMPNGYRAVPEVRNRK